MTPSPQEIEAVARAMRKAGANYDDWHLLSEFRKIHYRLEAQAAIRALDQEREKEKRGGV